MLKKHVDLSRPTDDPVVRPALLGQMMHVETRQSNVARFRRKRGWACVAHGLSVESPVGYSRTGYARSTREAAFGENSLLKG